MKLLIESSFCFDGNFSRPRVIVKINKKEKLGDVAADFIFEEFDPLVHPGEFIVSAIKDLGMSFTITKEGNYYIVEFYDGIMSSKTISSHQELVLKKLQKIVDYVLKYKELKKAFGM